MSRVNKSSLVKITATEIGVNIFTGKVTLKKLNLFDDFGVKIGDIEEIIFNIRYKPLFSGQTFMDSLIVY